MKQQQGWQANQNGAFLKNDIAQRLIQHGYEEWREPPGLFTQPYFIRHLANRFHNMYGGLMAVDFYVWHPDKYFNGLIIQAKYQQVNGSVDEKLPYLITSLKMTKVRALLFLLGNGFRTEAKEWCLTQQDASLAVLIGWDDLVNFCNKGGI